MIIIINKDLDSDHNMGQVVGDRRQLSEHSIPYPSKYYLTNQERRSYRGKRGIRLLL